MNPINKISVNGTVYNISIPYSDISYSVTTTSSSGGSLSLSGESPLHVVTLTGDITQL